MMVQVWYWYRKEVLRTRHLGWFPCHPPVVPSQKDQVGLWRVRGGVQSSPGLCHPSERQLWKCWSPGGEGRSPSHCGSSPP